VDRQLPPHLHPRDVSPIKPPLQVVEGRAPDHRRDGDRNDDGDAKPDDESDSHGVPPGTTHVCTASRSMSSAAAGCSGDGGWPRSAITVILRAQGAVAAM
jgi:hypothetical protein